MHIVTSDRKLSGKGHALDREQQPAPNTSELGLWGRKTHAPSCVVEQNLTGTSGVSKS